MSSTRLLQITYVAFRISNTDNAYFCIDLSAITLSGVLIVFIFIFGEKRFFKPEQQKSVRYFLIFITITKKGLIEAEIIILLAILQKTHFYNLLNHFYDLTTDLISIKDKP